MVYGMLLLLMLLMMMMMMMMLLVMEVVVAAVVRVFCVRQASSGYANVDLFVVDY